MTENYPMGDQDGVNPEKRGVFGSWVPDGVVPLPTIGGIDMSVGESSAVQSGGLVSDPFVPFGTAEGDTSRQSSSPVVYDGSASNLPGENTTAGLYPGSHGGGDELPSIGLGLVGDPSTVSTTHLNEQLVPEGQLNRDLSVVQQGLGTVTGKNIGEEGDDPLAEILGWVPDSVWYAAMPSRDHQGHVDGIEVINTGRICGGQEMPDHTLRQSSPQAMERMHRWSQMRLEGIETTLLQFAYRLDEMDALPLEERSDREDKLTRELVQQLFPAISPASLGENEKTFFRGETLESFVNRKALPDAKGFYDWIIDKLPIQYRARFRLMTEVESAGSLPNLARVFKNAVAIPDEQDSTKAAYKYKLTHQTATILGLTYLMGFIDMTEDDSIEKLLDQFGQDLGQEFQSQVSVNIPLGMNIDADGKAVQMRVGEDVYDTREVEAVSKQIPTVITEDDITRKTGLKKKQADRLVQKLVSEVILQAQADANQISDLADLVGIRPKEVGKVLANYQNERKLPTEEVLARVAEKSGVSADNVRDILIMLEDTFSQESRNELIQYLSDTASELHLEPLRVRTVASLLPFGAVFFGQRFGMERTIKASARLLPGVPELGVIKGTDNRWVIFDQRVKGKYSRARKALLGRALPWNDYGGTRFILEDRTNSDLLIDSFKEKLIPKGWIIEEEIIDSKNPQSMIDQKKYFAYLASNPNKRIEIILYWVKDKGRPAGSWVGKQYVPKSSDEAYHMQQLLEKILPNLFPSEIYGERTGVGTIETLDWSDPDFMRELIWYAYLTSLVTEG